MRTRPCHRLTASAVTDAMQIYTDANSGRFCKSRNNCTLGFKCEYFDLCAGLKDKSEFIHKDANCEIITDANNSKPEGLK